MTLVDANILIDLFTDDREWAEWSAEALTRASAEGAVGINPVIYAEASIAFTTQVLFEASLCPLELTRWDLPYNAGFRAGKAFLAYRRKKGERRSPLPDFYIGAHAAENGLRLLTRDPRRYRKYFPEVDLIVPDNRDR